MNSRTPTKEEALWMSRIAQIGCICCVNHGHIEAFTVDPEFTAIHHIEGSRKRGAHLKTIPLCYEHHQGSIGIHGHKKSFIVENGTEYELLDQCKKIIEERFYYE